MHPASQGYTNQRPPAHQLNIRCPTETNNSEFHLSPIRIVFDRAITVTHPDCTTSTNFIDLYNRVHFVLETKQEIQAQDDPGTRSVSAGPSPAPHERQDKATTLPAPSNRSSA